MLLHIKIKLCMSQWDHAWPERPQDISGLRHLMVKNLLIWNSVALLLNLTLLGFGHFSLRN